MFSYTRRLTGDIEAAVVSLHFSHVNEVKLTYCSLTAIGVRELVYAIEQRTKPLDILDLSNNQFGDEGASELVPALHNINRLNLSGCKLTSKGIGELAKVYETLTKPIKSLNICDNVVGKEAFDLLSTCLTNIEEIRFTRYKVTSDKIVKKDGFPARGNLLGNFIMVLHVKSLNFSEHQCHGDVEAAVVSFYVSQLNKVKLSSWSMTPIGVRELAYAIKRRTKPLKLLDLSCNRFGDEGASELVPALHNINRLNLYGCELTSKGIRELAKVYETLTKPVFELDISLNEVRDQGAKHIASALHKIDRLYLCDCQITQDGILALMKACKQRATPVFELNIRFNKFGDQGAKHIASALHKIDRLDLCGCQITQDGILALIKACKQRATPMVLLDLSLNSDIDKEMVLVECQDHVQELILQ